ncbi:MAG TPA: hypothetical protein VN962_16150 [Polyangia bacterium]|nr:hypothetical protein [Polyangia bacterium]
MRAAEALAVAALVIGSPLAARADGAFPAGQAVLVPEDRPQELLLVTNFGVVLSEDGGATWTWSCEQDANAMATLYQRGPAPRQRLFAVATPQVVYSDDATCSWHTAGGLLAGQTMTDLFPDPTNADRVVAIGIGGGVGSVFESTDGGATFDTVLYQAAPGDIVTSVEIARSDPAVVYVALADQDQHPKLARSSDAGAHWTVTDLWTDLGAGLARIIAIDPDDADTVILRWSSQAGGEAVAVSHDGGTTASKPLAVPLYFTSFARLPDGALVVSAVVAVSPATKAALFVSRDGAVTFQENDAVPSVAALAQRDGVLYAATDNFADGYALGASRDLGVTWEPVVRFDQVRSIMACLQANPQCQATCESLAGKGLASPGQIWDESVCLGGANPSGTGGAGGASSGGAPGGTAGSGGGVHNSSGGGCTLAPGPIWPWAPLAVGLMLIALTFRRARRRHHA